MLVELLTGGTSHRFHPSSPSLAVPVPVGQRGLAGTGK